MRISRERKPKGSRRQLRLLAAGVTGSVGSWAAWEAPTMVNGGRGLMVLAIGLAVGCGLLVRLWWRRVPFDLDARVPWALSVRAWMAGYQRPVLGWSRGFLGEP